MQRNRIYFAHFKLNKLNIYFFLPLKSDVEKTTQSATQLGGLQIIPEMLWNAEGFKWVYSKNLCFPKQKKKMA